MIFESKKLNGKKAMVYDSKGNRITTCFKYNTKTREAFLFLLALKPKSNEQTLLLCFDKKGKIVKAKVKLPGSYILVDGKRL